MNESEKDNVSSNKFGRNQHSNPMIQTNKNKAARDVIRKKIKRSKETERYQTNTRRNCGQIGKQTQKRKPIIKPVVMR